ncbi:MAG: aminopeptidase N [Xanthomonadales bacterium]|nr:aminopeptidase N [Xanthomonadales bacterium]
MPKESSVRTVYREQYRVPAFLIDAVRLRFQIDPEATRVSAQLSVRRNPDSGDDNEPLILDGQDMELHSVSLDGRELDEEQYEVDAESLTVPDVPDRFELQTVTTIRPADNTALEGLYLSGPFLVTQCEAEGFRKITYFLDRPDVMARFSVRIEADAQRFPVLLSNGNCVETGELDGGRHYTEWDDPFPKPSYLFALVAGDLQHIEDTFRTADDRTVTLRIYAEPENIDKLDYAMASLKRSMAWDEERFGLLYDLDIFNIVATNDFNMGAMENKSLNIFNAKYVLARPDTATDFDYQGIEGVIGHEYFHNWTGNRVTCRDWFQLSLKEGLTVFRDQEFSSDMQSRAVKRIEDVRMLRSAQFAEDAGPMAHPVRPDSYIEISNFYTLTVYEKGSEVVRLYHTLLGEEGFQKGLRLYFERHDGQAVTCDDFRRAMADANGTDLEQFGRWYSQAGTPIVEASDKYDETKGEYRLTLKQRTPATPGQPEKLPLQIPVRVGLLNNAGHDLPLKLANGDLGGEGDVLVLNEAKQEFVFEGIGQRPVPSLLRGFSAPVILKYAYTRDQLAFLMAHDSDSFNRWDASQRLASEVILELVDDPDRPVDQRLLDAALRVIEDRSTDPALLAEALRLPDEDYLAQQHKTMDYPAIFEARKKARQAIATHAADELEAAYQRLTGSGPYRPEPAEIARRSLRNTCLAYLACSGDDAAFELADRQYRDADNMTDRFSALVTLVHNGASQADAALEDFYTRFENDALVLDKWFAVQAAAPVPGSLQRVERLMEHRAFSIRNPNKVRALIGAFTRNPLEFHATGGAGYRFLADRVLELDRLNPQIAARLVSAFNHWKRLPESGREAMRSELERLVATKPLSKDVYEIVSKALA